MTDDLKLIKKKYGEKMMHLCREMFNTILDNNPGVLSTILLETFEPNHDLADDIINRLVEVQFKNYIYSLYTSLNCTKNTSKTPVEDPITLMKKAGYTLYECKTEEEIQKFRKYYARGEELCTFTQGNRLRSCYVYFAVKDNVSKIKRRNFKQPQRQDEYGTSVISIQFTRDNSHTLSIKNRYNHTVINPDATFANNLDNIIPGLTQSFEDYYGMKQSYFRYGFFELPDYVRASDGKYYKYNYEIDNVYYCPGNIVIDNFQVERYPREKYIVVDYFIIDLVNKKIINKTKDSFPETIGNIRNISIEVNDYHKKIKITPDNGNDIIIVVDKYNRIVNLINENILEIGDSFLFYNETLENIFIENVKKIGNDFLLCNNKAKVISLPEVRSIGNGFMLYSRVEKINLEQVETIGNNFLGCNYTLKELELPEVKSLGAGFMCRNLLLEVISLPKVVSISNDFFENNVAIKKAFFPEVRTIGNSFMMNAKNLEMIYMPKVLSIGDYFLLYNQKINKIELLEVTNIGNNFMRMNSSIKTAIFPKLINVGRNMLDFSFDLEEFVVSEELSFKLESDRLKTIFNKSDRKVYRLKNN